MIAKQNYRSRRRDSNLCPALLHVHRLFLHYLILRNYYEELSVYVSIIFIINI